MSLIVMSEARQHSCMMHAITVVQLYGSGCKSASKITKGYPFTTLPRAAWTSRCLQVDVKTCSFMLVEFCGETGVLAFSLFSWRALHVDIQMYMLCIS